MASYVLPGGARILVAFSAVLLAGSVLRAGQATAPQAAASNSPAGLELFETKIRPLLATNCYACHTQSAMGGLRVDSRDALLKGGDTGPALVAGEPEQSTLLKVLQHAEGFPRMPR